MPDLSTTYMDMTLPNPIIVASSDLTSDADRIKKCEAAGAGAVVMKSIFEEQFLVKEDIPETEYSLYPEALDYMRSGGLLEYAPSQVCREIESAKKSVSIPIIASINCQTSSLWPRFAHQVQEAGADALELNIFDLPISLDVNSSEHDDRYFRIIGEIKKTISIPIAVKLIPEISSLPFMCRKLSEAGCKAVVLFNWFLEPDINIKTRKTISRKGKANFNQALRWVALLADRISADIAASGGVGSAEDVVKQLLTGADAVQICSLFYRQGLDSIPRLLQEISDWMVSQQFDAIKDFRGELSFKKQELSFRDLGEAENYFRAQYLKAYSK